MPVRRCALGRHVSIDVRQVRWRCHHFVALRRARTGWHLSDCEVPRQELTLAAARALPACGGGCDVQATPGNPGRDAYHGSHLMWRCTLRGKKQRGGGRSGPVIQYVEVLDLIGSHLCGCSGERLSPELLKGSRAAIRSSGMARGADRTNGATGGLPQPDGPWPAGEPHVTAESSETSKRRRELNRHEHIASTCRRIASKNPECSLNDEDLHRRFGASLRHRCQRSVPDWPLSLRALCR